MPVDKGQVGYLYKRLLQAEPDELLVIRQMLIVQKDGLVDRLWTVVEQRDERSPRERLRAAASLALFEADSTKWKTISRDVAQQLVTVSPSSLAQWKEAFRPVRLELLAPLSDIFQDRDRTETQRSLATDILIDYAADKLAVLANLVMNADTGQFVLVFPKLEDFGDRAVSVLESELSEVIKRTEDEPSIEALASRQANAAMALLRLSRTKSVWPLLRHNPKPSLRHSA